MASLKPYTFKLAPLLGMTPAALYERQRALVRAGILEQGNGRGPGSGVQVSASSVALLLIAALATSNLSEAEVRARDIATARPHDGASRQLRASSFHDAVASILASKTLSLLVTKLTIFHSAVRAEIHLGGEQCLTFGSANVRSSSRLPAVRIMAEVDGEVLQKIAAELAESAGGAPATRSPKKRMG